MNIIIAIFLAILGAGLGSFACCQAWRIKNKDKSKRSHCEKCKYQLSWHDNIPILSWIHLRGRCRKCRKPIGISELLSELSLAILFPLSYFLWPSVFGGYPLELWWHWASFVLFLTLLVGFTILFIFDARWGKLPNRVLTFCIICAILITSLRYGALILSAQFSLAEVADLILALLILPGLYFALYKVSKEQWVGSGDWLVALPIAIILSHWWLAICAVFVSNLLGSIIGIVMMRKQKTDARLKIPFGPFFVMAFLIIFFASDWLLSLIA